MSPESSLLQYLNWSFLPKSFSFQLHYFIFLMALNTIWIYIICFYVFFFPCDVGSKRAETLPSSLLHPSAQPVIADGKQVTRMSERQWTGELPWEQILIQSAKYYKPLFVILQNDQPELLCGNNEINETKYSSKNTSSTPINNITWIKGIKFLLCRTPPPKYKEKTSSSLKYITGVPIWHLGPWPSF